MATIKATPDHEAFRTDILAVLDKHAGKLDSIEMLALSSHLTGQILALMDHRTVTPEQAMEVVRRNIEMGNAEAITAAAMGKFR